ncbi:hypothetical protein AJ80_06484 [Polytolypa hystricis UAMH7299]|uniref:Uncharacterized protein n=1 Tax=Polytolypa hystricis (strain UAMH7299) TaxID=1447883 RepID=A0A2B7XVF9_POLH7|nr:hypothetical protein AJ80_06484 [Polytolypa hystricis UAMH7299]
MLPTSNGIRFSISDLSPPLARIVPTLYQDRAGISLYDVQYQPGSDTRQSIPADIQHQVISRLLRFKETCADFSVPSTNIHVLATEATRTAPNSVQFRNEVKTATGWEIRMLSKEDEGRIGALGIASSLSNVQGLVMDLGGGSTQITWLLAKDGSVKTNPKGSISFPYGAAALTRRLEEAKVKGDAGIGELQNEMTARFRGAYEELAVPNELSSLADQNGGYDLYLSGGGFRGWGYLLMSRSKVYPYPIPTINGFKAERSDFQDTVTVLSSVDPKIFRVSERRAAQVPAVAFLINVLTAALPMIKNIHFCQGGVREGFLFDNLTSEIRVQDPLVVATTPYQTASAETISQLLSHALPSSSSNLLPPASFTPQLLRSFANLIYEHSSVPKDARPAAALHTATTGLLASAHGISHTDRALISLMLCARWPGDLPPSEESLLLRLRQIVSMREAWWCRYLGRVAALTGEFYPAGVIRDIPRFEFRAEFVAGNEEKEKKKGVGEVMELTVVIPPKVDARTYVDKEVLKEGMRKVEKVGKKKNWIKASERVDRSERLGGDWGLKVKVVLERGVELEFRSWAYIAI